MTDRGAERFSRFLNKFVSDDISTGPAAGWTDEDTRNLIGHPSPSFTEFLSTHARTSYGGGLLRFLLPDETPSLLSWNGETGWGLDWPRWRRHLVVFAYDWMGRQFTFDRQRLDNASKEPMINILEPGTGEVLEIPEDFYGFINRELVDYEDAALAAGFYREWRAAGGAVPTVKQCVGYRIPLFLGGQDDISNMELSDMEVYLSLCGQLSSQIS